MTMEASESEWNTSRRGFPLGPSFERARPSTVAKLTRPMMLRARECSILMSHSSLGSTEGEQESQGGYLQGLQTDWLSPE